MILKQRQMLQLRMDRALDFFRSKIKCFRFGFSLCLFSAVSSPVCVRLQCALGIATAFIRSIDFMYFVCNSQEFVYL